jgi:hypothetical protein
VADGGGDRTPGVDLALELLAAGGGQLVVLRSPVVLRRPPAGADPAPAFEAVQSRVEGPLRDGEDVT